MIELICIKINGFKYLYQIGLMSSVFANGSGDWGSIPGKLIPKTPKMLLDAVSLVIQRKE